MVWRSCQDDHVGYVLAASVVVDRPDCIVIYQPTGAPVLKRNGSRGGPSGRSLPPGGWDGTHSAGTWGGPPSLRAHQPGTHYSAIRHIGPDGIYGWYVNLELPWVHTPIGYDSRDLIVDIVCDPDLTSPTVKDLDELAWNRERGVITADEEAAYLAWVEVATSDIEARLGVFGMDWDPMAKNLSKADMPTMPSGHVLS